MAGPGRRFDGEPGKWAPKERPRPDAGTEPAPSWQAEQWIDEGPLRDVAHDAVERGSRPRRRSTYRRAERALALDQQSVERRLGRERASRVTRRLGDAAEAFAEGRYEDARKTLRPLVETVPDQPSLRELYGLSLYRLGRWQAAIRELEEFARLTGSTEQHPVLADCHRALGHHQRVEELWHELGAASPTKQLVAEGRIVYAGSLADRGRLTDAIAVLEPAAEAAAKRRGASAEEHHLRLQYALGDLYDRVGERHAAKRLFEAIATVDPGFADARDRARSL